MDIRTTKLEGVYIIRPDVYSDHRGFFMESYHVDDFKDRGLNSVFVQDNQSKTVQAGTIRGLHYQLMPRGQTKLVRVVSGVIYDVVVDLRKGSPTFGQWDSFILSEDNKWQLFIPNGFAHGFCTLVDHTEVLYKVDDYYSPENDRGILWSDKDLGIDWPIDQPILSEKDQNHPLFCNAEMNFNYGRPL